MKKYTSNSAISISATLPEGGNARVSFSPLSDGSSVYYTDDKEIQWALEHHYKFGKLFRLAEETEEQSAPAKKAPAKKTQGKSGKKQTDGKGQSDESTEEADRPFLPNDKLADASEEGEEAQEVETGSREVTVTDMDDAKDYLAEKFGVVRTKLKSEEQIKKTAESYGVVFRYV